MRHSKHSLKFAALILTVLLLAALLALAAFAAYPSSGASAPAGSALLTGELIGELVGWGGQTDKGRDAAFDGNLYTYYDPSARSDTNAYCGMDMGMPVILTKVMIHPRENWLDRYRGASIQGSNDLVDWETLWVSYSAANSWEWQEITEFENNTGYQYYRYWNGAEHGDVAEVEFYGAPLAGYNGPVQLSGDVIGERVGWDGTEGTGAAAAFDGDRYSYYDPTVQGADHTYCGIDAGKQYILSSVKVLPRDSQLGRFNGAEIQGSNDKKNWTTLCMSDHGVNVWDWQTFTEFDDNTGYRYFRYWNGREHGDVAEVRFYGYPADGNYTPPTPASLAVEVTEVTVRFDAGDPSGNADKTKKTVTIGAPYGDVFPELSGTDPANGEFLGWYTSRAGGVKITADTVVTRLSDHTLYAHWSADGGEKEAGTTAEAEQPTDTEPTSADPAQETPSETSDKNAPASAEKEDGDSGESRRSSALPLICIGIIVVSLTAMIVVMAVKTKEE